MITYKHGNIFDELYSYSIAINTVNCVGKMGKGVALLFKNRFPTMFQDYEWECLNNRIKPGDIHVWKQYYSPSMIFNFATKNHWKDPSEYEWIQTGLYKIKELLRPVPSLSIIGPALGCGLGGLNFTIVKEMINNTLGDLSNNIVFYEPKE